MQRQTWVSSTLLQVLLWIIRPRPVGQQRRERLYVACLDAIVVVEKLASRLERIGKCQQKKD